MLDGFVKAAAVTPKIRVADCVYNTKQICREMELAEANGAKIIVFPELCLTGYTCSDLFWQELLLSEAKKGLHQILFLSKGKDALVFVGLPWEKDGKLYNVAAAISNGRLLGVVPKRFLPNYSEFYEARHFTPGNEKPEMAEFEGQQVPFGSKLLFNCPEINGLTVGAEICEDLWVPAPPSIGHALAGATVIVNLSASDEVTGKDLYRRQLVSGQSARLVCGYIYADAGEGESSTDLVFGAHNIIAENGVILGETPRFDNQAVYSELDIRRLRGERRMTTYSAPSDPDYQIVNFHLNPVTTKLTRTFDPAPFVPSDKGDRERRCEGNSFYSGLRPSETSGAYGMHQRCGRHFRRTGFHSGAAGDRQSI